ncbi:MAG: hypothetical protein B7Y41_01240 [Hydrogenophilales bacterium 28-61-23]|nr:MAG: hypothetical protein B7Y41_01240 [Hydrogenophilales bacterium 28-61-23]
MTTKSILSLVVIGVLLTTALRAWPVLSGSEPYVRVTPSIGAGEINLQLMHQVETALMHAGIEARRVVLDRGGVTVRVADAATRDSAMSVLQSALGSSCTLMPDAVSPVPTPLP